MMLDATSEAAFADKWKEFRRQEERLKLDVEAVLSALTYKDFIDEHTGEAWTLAKLAQDKMKEIANLPQFDIGLRDRQYEESDQS